MRYVVIIIVIAVCISYYIPKAYVYRDIELRKQMQAEAEERISRMPEVQSSVELLKMY